MAAKMQALFYGFKRNQPRMRVLGELSSHIPSFSSQSCHPDYTIIYIMSIGIIDFKNIFFALDAEAASF
jgi:hypothetical protein